MCGATVPLHAAPRSACTCLSQTSRLRTRLKLVSDPSGFAVSLFRSDPRKHTHTSTTPRLKPGVLSGSGDPLLLRGTPPPCGVGTHISIQRGLWRVEGWLFSTTGFFSFSPRVAQLILGESTRVPVNAEVLRPREEMGASEPENQGEHATCSGTFRVTGCRPGTAGCSGLGVPPRQRPWLQE